MFAMCRLGAGRHRRHRAIAARGRHGRSPNAPSRARRCMLARSSSSSWPLDPRRTRVFRRMLYSWHDVIPLPGVADRTRWERVHFVAGSPTGFSSAPRLGLPSLHDRSDPVRLHAAGSCSSSRRPPLRFLQRADPRRRGSPIVAPYWSPSPRPGPHVGEQLPFEFRRLVHARAGRPPVDACERGTH